MATAHTGSENIALLIPAHSPPFSMVEFVRAAASDGQFATILVIDDGSGAESQALFSQIGAIPGVTIIHHEVNLGKGAALKTGMKYLLAQHPGITGVVTADCDGQHDLRDVRQVKQRLQSAPNALILGVREFGPGTPLRSRIGNVATRVVFRVLVGRRVSDTQTGLRGVPTRLLPELFRVPSRRFEFETDMLIVAARAGLPFQEVAIRTIYIAGNRDSHFLPFYDSVLIYFLLCRFALTSLFSALIDLAVFLSAASFTPGPFPAQIAGRAVSAPINFILVRRYVFHSIDRWPGELTRFTLWVIVLGATSFLLQAAARDSFDWSAPLAKIVVESALFTVNFLVQRDLIFLGSRRTALRR